MQQEILEKLIKTVLGHLNANYDCVIKDAEGGVLVQITGSDLNYLIGFRGTTLDALQHFLNSAYYNQSKEYIRIVVDVNGYREQRKNKLEDMTKNYIDRVRFFNKEVEMPVMSSSERRIVHTFVSNYDDVVSESVGSGRERRIVLKPKKP